MPRDMCPVDFVEIYLFIHMSDKSVLNFSCKVKIVLLAKLLCN